MNVWYLDSSAVVKFAVEEAESAALEAWRDDLDPEDVLMTCELALFHLAAATSAAEDLAGVVTYDDRMADAARAFGLEQLAPGR